MNLKDTLYRRQFKIILSPSTSNLDLNSLSDLSVWSNPVEHHYLLTLKNKHDPNEELVIFEKNFKEKTGLKSAEFKIEASYGPLTLQKAVDSAWF